ncbi:MAG: hypothetical protein FJ293_17190 [Planctomycetes bacterium]|nr:hypothetical protein [Planctomycetota bacterium]
MSLAVLALCCLLQDAAPPRVDPATTTPAPAATPPAATPPAEVATVKAPLVVPTPRPRTPEVPSYRVALRMKSGRRFTGVVGRDRDFHTLVHQGAHHGAAAYAADGRFKLRWVDGLDGEIELCWNQVEKLEVREVLDSSGFRAMEQRFTTARIVRRREAERPADDGSSVPAAAESTAPSATGTAPTADPGAAPPDARSPNPQVAPPKLGLLTEFPPDQGWSPDRKKQIEWRRTVVGAFPEPREVRFLEVYDRWEPLFSAWAKERDEQRAADAAKDERAKSEGRGTVRPAEPAPPAAPAEPAVPAAKPVTGSNSKDG